MYWDLSRLGNVAENVGNLRLVSVPPSTGDDELQGSLLNLREGCDSALINTGIATQSDHQWPCWSAGKGGTLRLLAPLLTSVRVDLGHLITRRAWVGADHVASSLDDLAGEPVLVRSDARGEDSATFSHAGRYESIPLLGTPCVREICRAVDQVFASYEPAHPDDAVFIQRLLTEVAATAVVTTVAPATAAPYITVVIDPDPVGTDGVTSGKEGNVTWHVLHSPGSAGVATLRDNGTSALLSAFLHAAAEVHGAINGHSGSQPLDLELLQDPAGDIHLLQARPLVLPRGVTTPAAAQIAGQAIAAVHTTQSAVRRLFAPYGGRGMLSNTTDWNPAEMIGQRPPALAASLYAHAITNRTWARQRAQYGYRDLTGKTLMHVLSGQPYVDVAASLESFIPATTPPSTAERLLAAQLDLLSANRSLHRSAEFTVATSCVDFSLRQRLAHGPARALSPHERHELVVALAELTTAGLSRLTDDLDSIGRATQRRRQIQSLTDPAERYLALQSHIADLAALPFAHVARAAFVATAFLRSSREEGLADESSVEAFMQGLNTISTKIRCDGNDVYQGRLSWAEFVDTYGHLRPGTYDLRERRYRDDPETFLRPFVTSYSNGLDREPRPQGWFTASHTTVAAQLDDLGLHVSVEELIAFALAAIRGREAAKFEYSAWVSDLLESLLAATQPAGLTRARLAHWTINDANTWCRAGVLPPDSDVVNRSREYQLTALVHLPAVITETDDLTCFVEPSGTATYIGNQRVAAPAHHNPEPGSPIQGIVVVDRADPGWEWLFSGEISGIVTAQGGANSHLAVRCAELGIPAAIGVGEDKMRSLRVATSLSLDCRNKRVEPLR